mgnify:CR=1 FL=1
MAVEIDITIDDKATESMNALLSAISGDSRSDLMQVASRAALVSMQEYYGDFNAKGGWINPSGPTHGPGRKSSGFGNLVTEGWNVAEADANGFTLNNGTPWLTGKMKDWTQTPSKQWLTIPLVPEAHGVRARDFPQKTFFAGRSIAIKTSSGEIKPVYALVKSVNHKKVKGAMAPEEVYVDPAIEAIEDELKRVLGV